MQINNFVPCLYKPHMANTFSDLKLTILLTNINVAVIINILLFILHFKKSRRKHIIMTKINHLLLNTHFTDFNYSHRHHYKVTNEVFRFGQLFNYKIKHKYQFHPRDRFPRITKHPSQARSTVKCLKKTILLHFYTTTC